MGEKSSFSKIMTRDSAVIDVDDSSAHCSDHGAASIGGVLPTNDLSNQAPLENCMPWKIASMTSTGRHSQKKQSVAIALTLIKKEGIGTGKLNKKIYG